MLVISLVTVRTNRETPMIMSAFRITETIFAFAVIVLMVITWVAGAMMLLKSERLGMFIMTSTFGSYAVIPFVYYSMFGSLQ